MYYHHSMFRTGIWMYYISYLPPLNCWSCLLLRGPRPSATVFKLCEEWKNPRLLSIPSVTMNWRQATIILWRRLLFLISDWSQFQVYYWINKYILTKDLPLVGVCQVIAIQAPSANRFLKRTLSSQTTAPYQPKIPILH